MLKKTEQSNVEENCVRVQHIVKDVGTGEKLARHFDNILEQISSRVGQFSYVYIFKEAKEAQNNERDTIGFLQLKDFSKHRDLAFLLKDYCFHGKCLDTQLAYFRFGSIDDDYVFRPVDCRHCNYYLVDLEKHENQLMREALESAKQKITSKPKANVLFKQTSVKVMNKSPVVNYNQFDTTTRTSNQRSSLSTTSLLSRTSSFSIIDEAEYSDLI